MGAKGLGRIAREQSGIHSCQPAEFVIPNGGEFERGACPLKLKKMAHMRRDGKRIVARSMQNQKTQHEC